MAKIVIIGLVILVVIVLFLTAMAFYVAHKATKGKGEYEKFFDKVYRDDGRN